LCNLIEGTYPDYYQVIPSDFEQKINFSKYGGIMLSKTMEKAINNQTPHHALLALNTSSIADKK